MLKKREKIKIKIVQNHGKNRQNSFWYNGNIGSVSRGEIRIDIVAHGDIRIRNKKGELLHDGWKTRGPGFPEFKHGLNTDKQLGRLEKLGYVWDNNNWFETFVGDSGDAGYVSYTLKEAIADAKEVLLDTEKETRKEAKAKAKKKQ